MWRERDVKVGEGEAWSAGEWEGRAYIVKEKNGQIRKGGGRLCCCNSTAHGTAHCTAHITIASDLTR